MRAKRKDELIPGAPGKIGNQFAIGLVSASCILRIKAS